MRTNNTPKVISFRVSQKEYDLLEYARTVMYTPSPGTKTMSAFLASLLQEELDLIQSNYDRKLKQEEAKAKRQAKKAAANDIV